MIADWPEIKAAVALALASTLASRPNLSRGSLIRWARAEARRAAEIPRLRRGTGKEIDALVDSAIAASS